jgi:hypothetical protein
MRYANKREILRMALLNYVVMCETPACLHRAEFKVAALWSDGHTQELKTYALSCKTCLASLFRKAIARQMACQLNHDETLEAPRIFDKNSENERKFIRPRDDLLDEMIPRQE